MASTKCVGRDTVVGMMSADPEASRKVRMSATVRHDHAPVTWWHCSPVLIPRWKPAFRSCSCLIGPRFDCRQSCWPGRLHLDYRLTTLRRLWQGGQEPDQPEVGAADWFVEQMRDYPESCSERVALHRLRP